MKRRRRRKGSEDDGLDSTEEQSHTPPADASPTEETPPSSPAPTKPRGFDPPSDADRALRPKMIAEFTGQTRVIANLEISIAAAKGRKEPLDHVLLSGPPGLGKTTLANILANEMGATIKETSAHLLEKPGDLAGVLSTLQRNDVLFIDEIHALKSIVEEYLYSAMEDYRISIQIGEGATAQALNLTLSPFTLIGATTREGLLSSPFRSRFGLIERLDLYSIDELTTILGRSAARLGVTADEGALRIIAGRSRGTARIANSFLRRVRDVAQVRFDGHITEPAAEQGLRMLGVDSAGLTELDRRILTCLVVHMRPIGLKSVAIHVSEEEGTIEDTYEPWLLQSGLITKTPSGRLITSKGIKHLIGQGLLQGDDLQRVEAVLAQRERFSAPPGSAPGEVNLW